MQGIASGCVNEAPRKPLTETIVDDFEEALRRITEVEFLENRVLIRLVAGNPSVKFSILLLGTKVRGKALGFPYISGSFDLGQEWLEKFVTFDQEQKALIIPIPGVQELTLSDGKKFIVFAKTAQK